LVPLAYRHGIITVCDRAIGDPVMLQIYGQGVAIGGRGC
jgi:hypothetical protein